MLRQVTGKYEFPYAVDFELPDIWIQLKYELEYYPNSCLSKLIGNWYNATYVALGDSTGFICCEDSLPSGEAALIQAVLDLVKSKDRCTGERFLTDLYRDGRRCLIEELSQQVI